MRTADPPNLPLPLPLPLPTRHADTSSYAAAGSDAGADTAASTGSDTATGADIANGREGRVSVSVSARFSEGPVVDPRSHLAGGLSRPTTPTLSPRAGDGIRTRDVDLGKVALYH